MFTCYPKYNINLGDKDFDNSLSLYFKFLRNDFMKEGNNVMTMYYSVLYTLSNSNYGRIYQDKPFIEISDECCKTRENSNFLKNGKTVISVKIRNFSISRMTKRTSPLESSPEI